MINKNDKFGLIGYIVLAISILISIFGLFVLNLRLMLGFALVAFAICSILNYRAGLYRKLKHVKGKERRAKITRKYLMIILEIIIYAILYIGCLFFQDIKMVILAYIALLPITISGILTLHFICKF